MPDRTSMEGKVCLITGATSGIGRVTAESLAGAGARVVLVGRSKQKTGQAVREIKENTGSQQVDSLIADLSIQADVRRLAQEFRLGYNRLDVLINNAGAFFMRRRTSQDGIEMTFALNHLAYFLLTNLLLDLLIESAPARIINVSSNAHVAAKAKWDHLANPRLYNGWGGLQRFKTGQYFLHVRIGPPPAQYRRDIKCASPGIRRHKLRPGYQRRFQAFLQAVPNCGHFSRERCGNNHLPGCIPRSRR
jgi:NAD(P)-dependent dehydrogenase (short-subunit alcohol dehydrogenase family)